MHLRISKHARNGSFIHFTSSLFNLNFVLSDYRSRVHVWKARILDEEVEGENLGDVEGEIVYPNVPRPAIPAKKESEERRRIDIFCSGTFALSTC